LECIRLDNAFPSGKVFSLYIFTLLMFRKPNKTTDKTIKFYRNSNFRFPFIFRHFKCPKCSPMVCLICYYLPSIR